MKSAAKCVAKMHVVRPPLTPCTIGVLTAALSNASRPVVAAAAAPLSSAFATADVDICRAITRSLSDALFKKTSSIVVTDTPYDSRPRPSTEELAAEERVAAMIRSRSAKRASNLSAEESGAEKEISFPMSDTTLASGRWRRTRSSTAHAPLSAPELPAPATSARVTTIEYPAP